MNEFTLTRSVAFVKAHRLTSTICPAGAGIKRGHVVGETDVFSYNLVKDPVHISDLNATLLHQLGINHEAFTYRGQGRDYRHSDLHGHIVKATLA